MRPILASTVASAVTSGRAQARQIGHSTLLGELEAQVDDDDYYIDAPFVDGEEEDDEAGLIVGFSFASHWERTFLLYLAGGMLARRAARAALSSQAWRLDMVATTEAAQAFNLEREASMLRYARTIKAATLALTSGSPGATITVAEASTLQAMDPPITKRQARALRTRILRPFFRWDAELDERTCEECERLNGSVVPADIGWTNGPPVHPRCRCLDNILMLPATFRWAA